MSGSPGLRDALLDVGLEDLIPLPEIAATEEVRNVAAGAAVADVGAALVELLREGRIQVWSGHWSQDPQVVVDQAAAERLLLTGEQYEFNSRADQEARVYFVNVANLRA